MSETRSKCNHYTPAEDESDYAYMHRTYGCPDEGVKWPLDVIRELERTGKRGFAQQPSLDLRPPSKVCEVCKVEFEPRTPIVRRGHPSNYGYYHAGCFAKMLKKGMA